MDANAVGLHGKNNGVSSGQSTQIVESIETEPSGEQRKTVQWTSSHDDCKNDEGEQHTYWRYAYIYAHEYVAYEITNRCGQQEFKLPRKSHRDFMKWITTFHGDRTEGAACKGFFHQKKKT